MAIYHFSGQMISRISKQTGKPKSPLAAAAYRSGDKLKDEVDGQTFFYKREIQPDSFILKPKHAPKWALDREKLWNEVNRIEKNYNSQLAREFNVALPIELSKDDQRKLVEDFCQEAFVDQGMVADVSIHRDDENNPHFHVMLTVRPFKEDGSWGIKAKREYKFDKNGNHILDKNGKKAFYKVDSTNWNQKETFNQWRELWAIKANYYLEENGFSDKISHMSNEDRGIEKLPTIHEGYIARKMDNEGRESERVSFNKNVNHYNKTISKIDYYKEKKNILTYQNKFVRSFTPNEKKQISNLAKNLKFFINSSSLSERKTQLENWKNSIKFKTDNEQKIKQLDRIDNEYSMILEAENILSAEANRFINKYYTALDINDLSLDEKLSIVDETINNKKLLTHEEISLLKIEVKTIEIEREVNNVLKNRYSFVLTLNDNLESLNSIRVKLEKGMGITDISNDKLIKNAQYKYPNEMKSWLNVIRTSNEFSDTKKLINELYNLELEKLYPGTSYSHYSLEEKEFLVVGSEYYGTPIVKDNIDKLSRYNINDRIKIISMLSDDEGEKFELMKKDYPDFQYNNPRYLLFFKDECLKDIEKLPKDSLVKLQKIDPIKIASDDMSKSKILRSSNQFVNNTINEYINEQNSFSSQDMNHINAGVMSGVLQGILEKRDFASKKQFEDDLKSKSKKKRSGPTL
ncbi:hypothetical protein BTS2_3381 [Bacillus sp. TS-2]|nr:hypothetical protein BTS2_3381 [Bacillus sp. TS-2]